MSGLFKNGINYTGAIPTAEEVPFDTTKHNIGDNVQEAIDWTYIRAKSASSDLEDYELQTDRKFFEFGQRMGENEEYVRELNSNLSGQGAEFELGNLVANSYVEWNSGVIKSYDGWSRTDYIDISALTNLIPNIGSGTGYDNYNCFYDSSKNFISNFSILANSRVEIPQNAKYVIFSNYTSTMQNLSVKFDGLAKEFKSLNESLTEWQEDGYLPKNYISKTSSEWLQGFYNYAKSGEFSSDLTRLCTKNKVYASTSHRYTIYLDSRFAIRVDKWNSDGSFNTTPIMSWYDGAPNPVSIEIPQGVYYTITIGSKGGSFNISPSDVENIKISMVDLPPNADLTTKSFTLEKSSGITGSAIAKRTGNTVYVQFNLGTNGYSSSGWTTIATVDSELRPTDSTVYANCYDTTNNSAVLLQLGSNGKIEIFGKTVTGTQNVRGSFCYVLNS